MCGIAAILADSASVDFDKTASRLMESLRHRGPDFAAEWRHSLGDGRILSLLHTRLAILDLSPAGRQPMRDVETGNVIIFNGEIYNFSELKAELRKLSPGYDFHSASDTEVLLRGYAAWGTSLLPKLDGMFAFILFDRRRRKLVIARDHVGIKPLYFSKLSRGGWAFASEVRALVGANLAEPRIDPIGIASFLRLGAIAEPMTICQGVRAFPPGSWAELPVDAEQSQDMSPVRYWNAESFLNQGGRSADHPAVLTATLREQLVADVPIGLFLSAGIDSSVLAAVSAQLAPGRIKAFTIRSGQGADDESTLAAQSAQKLGLGHVIEELAHAKAEAWILDGISAMDQPSSDGINTYLISRASRECGMIAVLSGTGADELHGGYAHFFSLPRWRNLWLASAARLVGPGVLQIVGKKTEAERLHLLLSASPSLRAMLMEKRRYFTPSWRTRHAPEWLEAPGASRLTTACEAREPRDEIALGELSGYLLNTLLRDSDWATMANSQELRVPFLGRRYIEYVLGLSWSEKGRRGNGPNKPLLSQLLPTELRSIIERPKTGFELDYVSLLIGAYRTVFLRATRQLNEIGFSLDGEQLLRDLGASRSRKDARRLWALLGLGSYLERHGFSS